MKELRHEAQEAYNILANYLAKHTGITNPDEREVLEILEDHPIHDSSDAFGEGPYEWSVDVYKVGDHFIRAMVPYTPADATGCQRIDKTAEFDLNSLSVVYPVKVMVTKYKTLEEIKSR